LTDFDAADVELLLDVFALVDLVLGLVAAFFVDERLLGVAAGAIGGFAEKEVLAVVAADGEDAVSNSGESYAGVKCDVR